MDVSLYIARRLSLSSGSGKSAPSVKVAVAAVAISVAVMLAAVSILMGFKNQITDKVVGFNSHISLYTLADSEFDTEQNVVTLNKPLSTMLDSAPFVTSYSLELSMPAILKTEDDFKGVYIKGLSRGADVSFLSDAVIEGKIPDFSDHDSEQSVVISRIAATQLGLSAGDSINTYFITDDIRVRRLAVAAVIDTHFENYDDLFIYGSLPMLQKLSGVSSIQGTAIKLRTDDFHKVAEYTDILHRKLMYERATGNLSRTYLTTNALQQGAGYFQWLAMLDTNVAVVLALMIAVACITLISGMLILIIDKTRFIGIVRSAGMDNRRVARVFVYLSIRVALTGLVIGNAVMLSLLALQYYTHIVPLNAESYYFDYVPVTIGWKAVAALNVGAIVIIFLSLLLPSLFVSRIPPSKAMRYE